MPISIESRKRVAEAMARALIGKILSDAPVEINVDHMVKILIAMENDAYVNALRQFAWWKDGVQYVGTTGTTLKAAIKEFTGFDAP